MLAVLVLSADLRADEGMWTFDNLPIRQLKECLIEELRRLDPDEVYGEVLTKGLTKVPS